jgi:hypothetical protein
MVPHFMQRVLAYQAAVETNSELVVQFAQSAPFGDGLDGEVCACPPLLIVGIFARSWYLKSKRDLFVRRGSCVCGAHWAGLGNDPRGHPNHKRDP